MLNPHIPVPDVSVLSTVLKVCFSIAWLLGVTCILYLTYKFIRNYTYVTMNCWFCNQNSRVPFKQKNEWICPRCEQFNGFTKDGAYIKNIPEQYHERLIVKKPSIIVPSTNNSFRSNGLCRTCNTNQELKIRQIASFVPLREADYDQEMEWFKEKLERSYKLCPVCVRTVQSTLQLKSRQYCPKTTPKTENYVSKVSFPEKDNSRNWKRLMSPLFTIITSILLWHHFKINEIFYEMILEQGKQEWPVISDQPSTFYVFFHFWNLVLLVSSALLTNYFGWTALLNSIMIGILSIVTYDSFPSPLKSVCVISTFLYFAFKYKRRRCCNTHSFKKLSNERRELDVEDEDNEIGQENDRKLDTPLCGGLSDLSLGRSQSASSSSKTSYLFRSSKLLIQPPKLILDDLDETTRSFHTVSSGYDSVTSFLRKSPDSVSEFDSVSQVGHKRFACFSRGSPNAIASLYGRSVYAPTYERLQSASSKLEYDQRTSVLNTSEIQASAFFSALQIFLCSLAFFILGFSFQLLISNVKILN